MEHEDFSGSQFSAIWESLSSDECCRSGSSTFLPELCSPENNAWLSSQSASISGGFLFGEDYTLMVSSSSSSQDQDLGSSFIPGISESHQKLANKQEHQKIVDVTNPDSPCSPLLFNFLPQSFEDQAQNVHLQPRYGAIQLQRPLRVASQIEDKECAAQEQSTAIGSKDLAMVPYNTSGEGNCTRLALAGDRIPQPSPSPSSSAVAKIKQECSATEQDEDCPFSKRQCLESRDSSRQAELRDADMPLPEEALGTSTVIGHALNTDGKPRAKRGSASDPQSVYARHRRERINERLRALQNLVPNGAKVDIVTMLEEAINYVKFLQLQVKLLSSDEYWTYAPTSYNGMNISLGMHIGMQSFISHT